MPELKIRKLHPVIGAEVTGINLAEPVDAELESHRRQLAVDVPARNS